MKPNRCVELSRVEREAQNALVGLVLLATPLANLPLPPFTLHEEVNLKRLPQQERLNFPGPIPALT